MAGARGRLLRGRAVIAVVGGVDEVVVLECGDGLVRVGEGVGGGKHHGGEVGQAVRRCLRERARRGLQAELGEGEGGVVGRVVAVGGSAVGGQAEAVDFCGGGGLGEGIGEGDVGSVF